MVQFSLSKQQKMLKDEVARVVRDLVVENAHDMDESGEIPPDTLQKIWELGLCVSPVPEAYGGFGLAASPLENAIAIEELAYGDVSVAVAALLPSLFIVPILELGTPAQQEKFLPLACPEKYPGLSLALNEPAIGFDPTRLNTTATRENGGYVLNGEKCLVPYAARASHILVAAALNGENRLFIVENQTSGLTIGDREKNMGLAALETSGVSLENCRVPEENCLAPGENAGFETILARTRTAMAAMGTGLVRASYEFARQYARTRQQFGEPIGCRQGVAFTVAEMAYETDALRFMTWRAASSLEAGNDARRLSYLAKLYADEMTTKLTDYGVQVLGGHGYIRDYPVERYYRNARGIGNFEALAIV